MLSKIHRLWLHELWQSSPLHKTQHRAVPSSGPAHSCAVKGQETEESPILSASEAFPIYTPESPSKFLHFHSPLIPITIPTMVSHRIIIIWILILSSKNSVPLDKSEIARSYPTLCNPMKCSLPCSSIHGIFQAKVLEWVAISFSRGSSWPKDQTLDLPRCRQTLYSLSQKCFLIR